MDVKKNLFHPLFIFLFIFSLGAASVWIWTHYPEKPRYTLQNPDMKSPFTSFAEDFFRDDFFRRDRS